MPTGVFACPNPRELCAVAGGYAYIIDAVRTYRSIGKMGKGALSTMHPEHLSAAVLAERLEAVAAPEAAADVAVLLAPA